MRNLRICVRKSELQLIVHLYDANDDDEVEKMCIHCDVQSEIKVYSQPST